MRVSATECNAVQRCATGDYRNYGFRARHFVAPRNDARLTYPPHSCAKVMISRLRLIAGQALSKSRPAASCFRPRTCHLAILPAPPDSVRFIRFTYTSGGAHAVGIQMAEGKQ